jgi:transcriptional regulator with XRE-family HTH domain
MVRARSKRNSAEADAAERDAAARNAGMDVNAVVSYNVKSIRELRGLTQEGVAKILGRLTGHQLPQASISAMERGFDGERRRRFDAHELYLLSIVFDVPIAYFFLPPPGVDLELADTHRPIAELYAALLGKGDQLEPMDDRLSEISVKNPAEADRVLAAIFGADAAVDNWHDHFRTWRKQRLLQVEREYGDRLDEVADFLAEFSTMIKAIGPRAYLQATAHRRGEPTHVVPPDEAIG